MLSSQKTREEIAEHFCVTTGSIAHVINRIRNAKPGSTLHQYQKLLEKGSSNEVV